MNVNMLADIDWGGSTTDDLAILNDVFALSERTYSDLMAVRDRRPELQRSLLGAL